MFDWNDDELADIIWGDANETDDHIVPYPKGSEENVLYAYEVVSKKQTSQETSTVDKSVDHKTSEDKNDLLGCKLENNSCYNTNEELSAPRLDMDSYRIDISGQDSMANKVSYDFPEVANFDSVEGQLDTDNELFGNEYKDKESGCFLDYSWANIGNFDDLENIFRNNDSILGNEMTGNADELWSSSADVSSPAQSYPLDVGSPSTDIKGFKITSEQFAVETELKPFKSQPLVPNCDKTSEVAETSKPMVEKIGDSTETTAEAASLSDITNESNGICSHLGPKVNRERKLLKCRKKGEGKIKAKSLQNMYAGWSPTSNQVQQFGNLKMQASTSPDPQTFPSSVVSPQRQLGGPEYLRFPPTSSPFMHMAYGYPTRHLPVMPMVPYINSERDRSQPVMAGYNYLPDPSRPSTMTPQEKVEKLRRRQQMQAMLAIQQQQQQLGHQVTCADHSVNHKCSQENKTQDVLINNLEVDENAVNLPSLESDSQTEQDNFNKFSTSNDGCTIDETIFKQLQDVVGKLDIQTRLCIRDSLFRLARSARQRRNICDTSSTNKSSKDEDDTLVSEDMINNDKSLCLPDAETVTNPIDRTVAHLLFQRPSEPCGRHAKDVTPESPVSGNTEKLLVQPKLEDSLSPPAGCSESSANKQSDSYQFQVDPDNEDQLRKIS